MKTWTALAWIATVADPQGSGALYPLSSGRYPRSSEQVSTSVVIAETGLFRGQHVRKVLILTKQKYDAPGTLGRLQVQQGRLYFSSRLITPLFLGHVGLCLGSTLAHMYLRYLTTLKHMGSGGGRGKVGHLQTEVGSTRNGSRFGRR